MSSSQASPPPPSSALYAATCNPPRKAKRARHDSVSFDPSMSSPHPTSPNAHNVRIRPAPTQPASTAIAIPALPSTSTKKSADAFPSTPAISTIPEVSSAEPMQLPPAKKRGRKPNNGTGGMSRSARESQRKINHSRIEKARRSKINDALDALRVLVPGNFGSEAQASSSSPNAKKEEKDKEFKLDILERTVLYVRHLVHKVESLEGKSNISVSAFNKSATESIDANSRAKRQYEEIEEDLSDVDGDCDRDGDDEEHAHMHDDDDMETEVEITQSQKKTAAIPTTLAAVQLPSISSWLGDVGTQPLEHHRQSAPNPPSTSLSPPLAASSIHRREMPGERRSSNQRVTGFDAIRGPEVEVRYDSGLLSPPGSGRIHAMPQPVTSSPVIMAGTSNIPGSLPSLRLPSPRAGLALLLNEPKPVARPGPSRTTSKWTPEDENVASLLLQISSSASSSSASPPESSPLTNRKGSLDEQDARAAGKVGNSPVMKKVQTPGAMLGIDFSKKGHSSSSGR